MIAAPSPGQIISTVRCVPLRKDGNGAFSRVKFSWPIIVDQQTWNTHLFIHFNSFRFQFSTSFQFNFFYSVESGIESNCAWNFKYSKYFVINRNKKTILVNNYKQLWFKVFPLALLFLYLSSWWFQKSCLWSDDSDKAHF